MSEIDEIFSSKVKSKVIQLVASTSSLPEKSKKRKDKKRKRVPVDDQPPTHPKSRPPPETVIDTSTLASNVKRPKIDKGNGGDKSKVVKSSTKQTGVGDERFKDSRGSGPRKKTEEGWAIYKEDELGIRDEGGDTPLCPFDCECCF